MNSLIGEIPRLVPSQRLSGISKVPLAAETGIGPFGVEAAEVDGLDAEFQVSYDAFRVRPSRSFRRQIQERQVVPFATPVKKEYVDRPIVVPSELDCFNLSKTGMAVVDTAGNLHRVNAAFGRLIGKAPDELIDTSFTLITHPDDVEAGNELVARLKLEQSDVPTVLRKRYLHADRSIVWVDLVVRPMLDMYGVVNSFFAEALDITARRLAEGESQRQLRELETAQRVAHLGSFEQNLESGQIVMSAELGRLFGIDASASVSADQLMGVVHADDRQRLRPLLVACSTSHTPIDVEHRLLLADGTLRWVHSRGEWVESESGGRGLVFGTVLDITDRKNAELASAARLRHLERSQEVARIGSLEGDLKSDCFEISPEGCRLFGITWNGSVSTRTLFEKVHSEDLERLKRSIDAAAFGSSPLDIEFRILLPEGTIRWLHARKELIARDSDGETRVVATVLDITDRKNAEDAAAFDGARDKLTGLANRSSFYDEVDRALRACSHERNRVALLLLDVDDFKSIADSVGHAVGDELLVDLARRLVQVTRAEDTVARFGGDEFAVLIESDDARTDAEEIAQRIVEAFRMLSTVTAHDTEFTARIGISVNDLDGRLGLLLRDAELAKYLVKYRHDRYYEFAEEGLQERALERLQTLADLRHCVEHDELEVVYQAIVNTDDSLLAGAEALVRWNHPTRGLVDPSSFIALAESSGLIVPIGRLVCRKAFRQLAEWRAAGVVTDEFYVSVNFSPRQLAEATLVANVVEDLGDAGLPAQALVLEITESTLMADSDAALVRVRALKDVGLRFALDDYGTGYSSLARLSEFPIDIIKIDKSFIDKVAVDKKGRAIVQSIIDSAAALGLLTVAEGVEDRGQRDVLEAMGCTFIQGYLFSKPLRSVDIEPELRRLQAPPRRTQDLLDESPGSGVTDLDHRVDQMLSERKTRRRQNRHHLA